MSDSLPFDTSTFEKLPISIIICEPVLNADGSLRDYRIVFGNEPFGRLIICLTGKLFRRHWICPRLTSDSF